MISKKRGICALCGERRKLDDHHVIPKCEGGTETIAICKRCHTAWHVRHNDFARWGQAGGRKTASTKPHVWMSNLRNQSAKLREYVL